MTILEECAEHARIFDTELGVLTFRVLCLSIGCAVLVRNNWHTKLLETLDEERERGYLPGGRVDISMHLVAWLSTPMTDIIKRGTQELHHGLAALHELFGFEPSKKTPNLLICLAELGEFNKHHAQFLLNHLWNDRKHNTKLFQEVFMPGWSVVLHVLWKHCEFTDDEGHEFMFMQLRELVLRYSLVCTSFEDDFMHCHFQEVQYCVVLPKPIDHNDLVMIVSCYVLKLVPPYGCPGSVKSISLEFALDLMQAIFYDVDSIKEYTLSLPLLKAGLTRLWVAISGALEDAEDIWVDVVSFTDLLLMITQYARF
ncbi:hypothetical protein FRC09_011622 [Ceratobasidium sp. 395]|nr:hypothetical protein FRC09_011622 [Ceratobasidium sp. 395]